MKTEEYVHFANLFGQLRNAAETIFDEEVANQKYLKAAYVTEVSFTADGCEVEYKHCPLCECDEYGTLHIESGKLLTKLK